MSKSTIKQLVILSGKGGTGKTSLAAAFSHLAASASPSIQAVMADADVDAANLELILKPEQICSNDFIGAAKAEINSEFCLGCGTCQQVCHFDAVIPPSNGNGYGIDQIACEGCAACVYQCPEEAISMQTQLSGRWYQSNSSFGPLFHAELFPGQENSGKLVTIIKQNARLWALDHAYQIVIVDGPPGIGCPVIAAAAASDLALIVSEPSAASIHDLQRAIQTTMHFHIPTAVVINKADVYPEGAAEIEMVCKDMEIELLGRIPYDLAVTEAMMHAEPVTLYNPGSPVSQAIDNIWQSVCSHLFGRSSKL